MEQAELVMKFLQVLALLRRAPAGVISFCVAALSVRKQGEGTVQSCLGCRPQLVFRRQRAPNLPEFAQPCLSRVKQGYANSGRFGAR